MELNLNKPIVFFDLETTGVNVGKDRIVQIGMIKVMPDGSQSEYTQLINPGMHISEESSRLTGITDADVAMSPKFKDVAMEIKEFIGNSDLAGYNSNKFDVPMLVEEFLRNGLDFDLAGRNLIDVQNIFHKMEQRTLIAAYKFYCHKDLEDAHSANGDTKATLEVLKAQLDMYKNADFKDIDGQITQPVKNDMQALAIFSKTNTWADLAGHIYYNDNLIPCFNFGKHKGEPVAEVFKKEPSYYAWMMNAEFPLSTKKIIKQIKELNNL